MSLRTLLERKKQTDKEYFEAVESQKKAVANAEATLKRLENKDKSFKIKSKNYAVDKTAEQRFVKALDWYIRQESEKVTSRALQRPLGYTPLSLKQILSKCNLTLDVFDFSNQTEAEINPVTTEMLTDAKKQLTKEKEKLKELQN